MNCSCDPDTRAGENAKEHTMTAIRINVSLMVSPSSVISSAHHRDFGNHQAQFAVRYVDGLSFGYFD